MSGSGLVVLRRTFVGFAAVAATACEGTNTASFSLTTVPTPAPYVSGGQTLVLLEAPVGVDLTDAVVTAGGVPAVRVASAPPDRLGRERNAVLALVEGLALGDNQVIVGFSRLRPTRPQMGLHLLKSSIGASRTGLPRPTRLACYDLENGSLEWELNLEKHGMNAVFSIL